MSKILYINGDSHAAGAEAVVSFAFAEDDPHNYPPPNRKPHPENEIASFGNVLADQLGMTPYNDSESASSNDRIVRTTRKWLEETSEKPGLVLIGWSTWEREEWFHDNEYFQVNCSGVDLVPRDLRDKYKQWIITQSKKERELEYKWHDEIHQFHLELSRKNINHLFFNTYQYFFNTVSFSREKLNWDNCYIKPYEQDGTYYYYLKKQGYSTVNKNSYHYPKLAHRAWADYLRQYLQRGGNHI